MYRAKFLPPPAENALNREQFNPPQDVVPLIPAGNLVLAHWSVAPSAPDATPTAAPGANSAGSDAFWAAYANGDAQVLNANGLNPPLFGPFSMAPPANGGGSGGITPLSAGIGSGGNGNVSAGSSSSTGPSSFPAMTGSPPPNPVLNSLVAASSQPAATSGAGFQPAGPSGAGFQPAAAPSAGSQPAATAPASISTAAPGDNSPAAQHLRQTFAGLPLAFEKNMGQTAAGVDYLARGQGYLAFLAKGGMTLSLYKALTTPQPRLDTVSVQLAGANPNATVQGVNDLLSRANYFLGPDPSRAIVNVPEYAGVQYNNVYNGVDLSYHSTGAGQGQIEFDFIVHPGADLSQIQLGFSGAAPTLDAAGNLVLHTPSGGNVIEHAPTLYQMDGNNRQAVQGQFVLHGDTAGFQATGYDPNRTLYIDPVIDYESYLGGSGADAGAGVAVDGAGNVYFTGTTTSPNFPGASGGIPAGQDVFVTKMKADGSGIVYTTILGSGAGDSASGIAVDAAGNVVVAGLTGGQFPTTQGAYQRTFTATADPFVFKLNGTGDALDWSTLAGSGGANEAVAGLALTPDGRVVLAGTTDNANSPTTPGVFQQSYNGAASDGILLELNQTGSALDWGSFFGGPSAADSITGLARDGAGNLYLAGNTTAVSGFPVTAGAYNTQTTGSPTGFVAKLNPTATSETYGTFLANNSQLTALGVTGSNAAAATNPIGGGPVTVWELNSAGSALAGSINLGQGGARAIGADTAGNLWIGGQATSSSFPQVNPTQASYGGGNSDGFVAEVNAALSSTLFSTFAGGSGDDAVTGLALSGPGHDTATVTGWTTSTNLPVSRAFQANSGGGEDAFFAQYSNTPPPPTFTGISPDTGSSSSDQITTARNLTLTGTTVTANPVGLPPGGMRPLGGMALLGPLPRPRSRSTAAASA